MSRHIRIAVVGLGNVGRALLELIDRKADLLETRYNLDFLVTGAADSSGAVLAADGLDAAGLRAHKLAGGAVATLPGGRPGMAAPGMVAEVAADIVLEAASVNLVSGQPGLDTVRMALRRRMGVVLADKGPLVHAFGELTPLAAQSGVGLAYSATVCGALPVVNIGRRDLVACDIPTLRGIYNSTSNFLLSAMTRGEPYDAALRQAQAEGVAETDPSLDVEGWDTANKLVIITNSILGQPATLADVAPVIGITGLDPAEIRTRAARGEIVKLVGRADREDDRYRLSVQPEWLPAHDFLATVSGWEMGIVFDTDIMGVQQFKVDERGPVPTAGAMLRDLVNLALNQA